MMRQKCCSLGLWLVEKIFRGNALLRWSPIIAICIACLGITPLLADDQPAAQTRDNAPFPNDPDYTRGEQYALDLINIQPAWRYTHGDPTVVVALIDTGIDYAHPELADHIHPDGRTFFLQGSAQDENGHGTLTAGIIAAATHNGLGTAGIAGNVQILPIKVSPGRVARQGDQVDSLLAPGYNFQEPIRYAASPDRHGTRVININFASSLDDPQERKAIGEVTRSGVLVVAAAGNTGQNRALFPAAYDCVLGVGAVDRHAQRASFSTYGLGVDVVAPGVSIYGTDLLGAKGYSADDYGAASGTSFAAPHAAGVAALLFSVRPDLTAWDARAILMRSARDLGVPGFDAEYGYGLIDAGAALELAKVWRANSGQVLEQCTGERYRVYGSLYDDQNQDGQRTAGEAPFSEPYTATTTYVELYGQNGLHRLAVTYPNHAGIFTFDVIYDPRESPYTIKVQNSTFHQELFFAGGVAGPYNLDLASLSDHAVVMSGTLFLDSNHNTLQDQDELFTDATPLITAKIALYAPQREAPIATATSDRQGNFAFYLPPPTTTMTYTLYVTISVAIGHGTVGTALLRTTEIHTITLSPQSPLLIPYVIALTPADLPIVGQDATPNPTPEALQVITHTSSLVFHWTTPQPLRSDSVVEIAYASQPGGPYQALGMTAFAQTTSYTLFDLPNSLAGGHYYFVARARTLDATQSAFWSDYSNEVTAAAPVKNLLFLPLIKR